MSGNWEPSSSEVLEEQLAYYRARAPVYDDWWDARGTDPRSDELRELWLAERSRLEADIEEWCAGLANASVLELAAGTGNLTCLVAPRVGRLTAVDASPEVLAINERKLGAGSDKVEFVVADLFEWDPPKTYDSVFFGFWISHVPADRWGDFWSMVCRCLRPGGSIWFCDNANPEVGWRAGVLPRPEARYVSGDGTIDPRTRITTRTVAPTGSSSVSSSRTTLLGISLISGSRRASPPRSGRSFLGAASGIDGNVAVDHLRSAVLSA